jgi:hypothetical protein
MVLKTLPSKWINKVLRDQYLREVKEIPLPLRNKENISLPVGIEILEHLFFKEKCNKLNKKRCI